MSQVPSPDLKQLYCVAIDIFSKGGLFYLMGVMTHHFPEVDVFLYLPMGFILFDGSDDLV